MEAAYTHFPQPGLNIVIPTQNALRRVAVIANRSRTAHTDTQVMSTREAGVLINGNRILKTIGEYEANSSTDIAIQKLERFEELLHLFIHPDVEKAMQQATNALRAQGINGLVIIPGGSSARGGMFVRDLAARSQLSGQDIDMSVQFEPNNKPDLHLVEDIIAQAISNVSSTIYPNEPIKFVLDNRHYFVPSHPSSNSPVSSEEDIWNILMPYPATVIRGSFESIADCFSLTYPQEYGERVRRDVLKTLSELYKVNPQRWERVIKILIGKINPSDPLVKQKHITDQNSYAAVVRGVDNKLREVKRVIVEDMLCATSR